MDNVESLTDTQIILLMARSKKILTRGFFDDIYRENFVKDNWGSGVPAILPITSIHTLYFYNFTHLDISTLLMYEYTCNVYMMNNNIQRHIGRCVVKDGVIRLNWWRIHWTHYMSLVL